MLNSLDVVFKLELTQTFENVCEWLSSVKVVFKLLNFIKNLYKLAVVPLDNTVEVESFGKEGSAGKSLSQQGFCLACFALDEICVKSHAIEEISVTRVNFESIEPLHVFLGVMDEISVEMNKCAVSCSCFDIRSIKLNGFLQQLG